MHKLDLVIRNARVVTASDTVSCDVGVRDGRIAALGTDLPGGAEEVDAGGLPLLPGGVDSHCHIEQRSSSGIVCADDFASGSISALFGGTTTIIPFAAQHRGESLREVVRDYHACAAPKSVADYAFHLIVSDPTEQVLGQELPALIQAGYSSFKVYMTYDRLRLDDYQMLEVLALARRAGALVMVHAENHDIIRWMGERLLAGGHHAPRYHAVAHARIAEGEATERAIRLAELLDVPLLVVHVSAREALAAIRDAQGRGLRVYAETCPQYLFLTAEDLARPGLEGAKFCCSPPPRDEAAQAELWDGLLNATLQVFSSDHAPYRFDRGGKLPRGEATTFAQMANGVPGIELRLPLLFSAGVNGGRMDLNRFVALTTTNPARLYGLHPRKGTIAVGSDADLVIWDPQRQVTVHWEMLHDQVGYTPYEGREITGWPVKTFLRGRLVIDDGRLLAEPGSGRFLRCAPPAAARPLGRRVAELDPAGGPGASIVPDPGDLTDEP